MQNNGSVMGGLHRISDRIAEASKQKNEPVTPPDGEVPVLPPEGALDAPGEESVAIPPEIPAQESSSRDQGRTVLADALLRRYDDFLKTRRDLSGRITKEITAIHAEQELIQSRQAENQKLLELLTKYAEEARESDGGFDPGNQIQLAGECRKIEHIRLEMIRLSERESILVSRKNDAAHVPGASSGSILPELQSLTFSQLAKAGFAFLFPVIAVIFLAAVIIAAAVILSLSGALAWG